MTIDAAATMLRAAARLDGAASAASRGLETELPRLFRRGRARDEMTREFTLAVAQAQLAVRELEPLGVAARHAREAIAQAIPKFDPTQQRLRIDQARQFGDFTDNTTRLRVIADRLRLQAELDGVPADVVRSRLQAEADAILDLPDGRVNDPKLWRLAVMGGLPAELRPRFPAPVKEAFPLEQVAIRGQGYLGKIATVEVNNLRLDRMRRAVEADPTVTREALEAELASMLDRYPRITLNDRWAVERISVMAGLPDELRPRAFEARQPWADHPIASLGASAGDPSLLGVASMKLDALRMAYEHAAMVADPAVTRETVVREVSELLQRPLAELDEPAMRRLSVLMRAPEHLRPPMPPIGDPHYRFDDLGLLRRLPSKDLGAKDRFLDGRRFILSAIDPDALVRELQATAAAGGHVDPRIVAVLLHQHPERLAAAGIDLAGIHDQALAAVARGHVPGVGSRTKELGDQLDLVRIGVRRTEPADDVQRAIRADLLELLDRNIARMRRERTDTFYDHPDYAEVGRISAQASLLRSLTAANPAPKAAEALPW